MWPFTRIATTSFERTTSRAHPVCSSLGLVLSVVWLVGMTPSIGWAEPPDAPPPNYDRDRDDPKRADLSERKRRQLKESLVTGRTLEKKGEYADALRAYRRAYDLFPHSAVLLSVARAHEELGHLERARRGYKAFLGRRPDYERRERIEATLERLEQQLTDREESSTRNTSSSSDRRDPETDDSSDTGGSRSREDTSRASEASAASHASPSEVSPPPTSDKEASRANGSRTEESPTHEGARSTNPAQMDASKAGSPGVSSSTSEDSTTSSSTHSPEHFGGLGWTGAGLAAVGLGTLVGAGIVERQRQQHLDALRRAARQGDEQAFRRLQPRTIRLRKVRVALLVSGLSLSAAGGTLVGLELLPHDAREASSPLTGLQWGRYADGGLWLGWRGRF